MGFLLLLYRVIFSLESPLSMANSAKSINESLKEYARGITGGLLFSLPMLYTMELWWSGFLVSPLRLTIYLFVGLLLLLAYNHYVGLRREHTLVEGISESVEELGLGLLLTAFVLWLTGRIAPGMSFNEVSGKIIVEAVTVAIGISVGKAQLGSGGDESENEEDKARKKNNHLGREINIAICGAVLIAANVAPTEEVVVIALEIENFKLFIMTLVSMFLGGGVLYYINFRGTKKRIKKPTSKYEAIAGTFIMYTIALVSSAFMLWFFGRFDGLSLRGIIAESVVLGFPATLGASAGRLLIQA